MFKLNKNKVTFAKGLKPAILKQAQREVRDTYLLLCETGAPRSLSLAKGFLIGEVLGLSNYEALLKSSPTYAASLNSAAKAYSVIGTALQKKNMYSMDFYIGAEDLRSLRGVPPELLQSLEAVGGAEVCISARES